MKTLLSHLPASLSLVIPASFDFCPRFLLLSLSAPRNPSTILISPCPHLPLVPARAHVFLSQASFFLHGTYVPSRIKTRRTTAMKEIDGGAGGEAQRQGGSRPAQKGTRCTIPQKPISVFIPLGKHTRMQKKKGRRPARSKNKSLHFLDILVALTFACAVSALTNVTKAHPSAVISFAE